MRVFQSFPRSQIKIVIAFFGSEPSADSCSAAKSHGAASQIDPTEKEHKIACSMNSRPQRDVREWRRQNDPHSSHGSKVLGFGNRTSHRNVLCKKLRRKSAARLTCLIQFTEKRATANVEEITGDQTWSMVTPASKTQNPVIAAITQVNNLSKDFSDCDTQ